MGKRKKDTNYIGQHGVSWIRWVVEGIWGCGTEVISAHNDDSIDMLILLKRRAGKPYAGLTGDVIFTQIKTGYIKRIPASGKRYSISIGEKYISEHKNKWLSFPGPTIMINVIPAKITGTTPVAYWTNLKNPENYTAKGQVFFEIRNKFDQSGKGGIYNLCWRWAEFRRTDIIEAPNNIPWAPDLPNKNPLSKISLFQISKNFYAAWKKHAKLNRGMYSVEITNRGWRHMTRAGRVRQHIHQSLQLLPVASKMLEKSSGLKIHPLGGKEVTPMPGGKTRERFYEGITARVTFIERQETTVRLIIERTIIKDATNSILKDTQCFFSIYEIARRKELI